MIQVTRFLALMLREFETSRETKTGSYLAVHLTLYIYIYIILLGY